MNSMAIQDTVRAVQWVDKGLKILDQRKLPDQEIYDIAMTLDDACNAIRYMNVRGAPAIGITAAYAVVLAVRERYNADQDNWKSAIEEDLTRLAASRPTAVNLSWAVDSMRNAMHSIESDPVPTLLDHAQKLHQEDRAANHAMGEAGANLLAGADAVLTHCNTGSLATGGYGTALGVVRSAYRRGLKKIYAGETRPWLQGARLTLWELQQDGIPATLIADSAAASLMASRKIQWVLVGADRIASNGDVANKIGTYSLAVLAKHHGVKFMVVAPTSTIDQQTESADQIVIEHRDSRELLMEHYVQPNSVVDAWNPVFDVTPADFIDALVTERGVVKPSELAIRDLLLNPHEV